MTGEDVENIIKEIEIMKEIKSPYIVRYFGNYFYNNRISVRVARTHAHSLARAHSFATQRITRRTRRTRRQRTQIAMELCDKGSVTDLIAQYKTLNEDMIKPIAKSVLGGLSYMHERKIVHRDIKPGNLLLTSRGEIKLGNNEKL